MQFNGRFSEADLMQTMRHLGHEVFFLQIGAMDGVTHDPIHNFVKELGWHGILVEPIPEMFTALRKNYAQSDNLIFENSAIADFDGHIEMTRINPAAAERGIFQAGAFGISTTMPDRGIFGGNRITKQEQQIFLGHSQKLTVPCCSLASLLEKHKIEKLDLMLIDTEGADWLIARQLPLKKYRPRVVYLEYIHLPQDEQMACVQHFHDHGYNIYLDENNSENFLAISG